MVSFFHSNSLFSFRFFLMYLINKDETEHTGQVSNSWLYFHNLLSKDSTYYINIHLYPKWYLYNHPLSSSPLSVRSHTCGRCTKSDAGTSSLLETASGSSMRISSDNFLNCFQRAYNGGKRGEGNSEWGKIREIEHVYVLVLSFICTFLSSVEAMHTLTALLYHLQIVDGLDLWKSE